MDTDLIKQRNLRFLDEMISKYQLKITVAEIMDCQSVYIVYITGDQHGFRLTATRLEKRHEFDEVKKKWKSKQFVLSLYNFLKRKYEKLSEEQILEVKNEFEHFVMAWEQLRSIRELERQEVLFQQKEFPFLKYGNPQQIKFTK